MNNASSTTLEGFCMPLCIFLSKIRTSDQRVNEKLNREGFKTRK